MHMDVGALRQAVLVCLIDWSEPVSLAEWPTSRQPRRQRLQPARWLLSAICLMTTRILFQKARSVWELLGIVGRGAMIVAARALTRRNS